MIKIPLDKRVQKSFFKITDESEVISENIQDENRNRRMIGKIYLKIKLK